MFLTSILNSRTAITAIHRFAMKFSANLAFMFKEKPGMIDRYALAKEAGFTTVETGFPTGYTVEQVTNAKENAGIDQVLINLYTGDVTKGELGVTFVPGKEDEFKNNLSTTITYAKALHCSMLHVMAGNINEPTNDLHWSVYESNLKYAADELEKNDLIGLIEPINNHTVPKYFMNSYDKAIDIIKRINSPNLRLMMDLFHLQHIKGDLTNNINKFLPYVGHVQIAQVPNRNEPNTSGEINYKYILELLESSGYKGYVGLEYTPLNGSKDGLSWIQEYGYSL